jgi:hypothetical protein
MKRFAWGAFAIASILVAAAAGYLTYPHHPAGGRAPSGLSAFRDPGRVSYSRHPARCHTRHHGQLPDRACTPGSVDPGVRQANVGATICRRGWTATVRPPEAQTEYAKYQVAYPAYRVPLGTPAELDHLVPLELGGSNDITNLWPEKGEVPNLKDGVERVLRTAVCDGKVSLAAAQAAIARDWLTALGALHVQASHR